MADTDLRDAAHWRHEDYTQRMSTKQWREILLQGKDQIIFHGHTRTLFAKNLGAGVVEIGKRPLPVEENL